MTVHSGFCFTVDYASSAMYKNAPQHSVVMLALRLASLLAGIGFAGYHNWFGRYSGMSTLSDKSFDHVIEMAYPHI